MVNQTQGSVLIVEDEEIVARMYKAGLSQSSFQVVLASNGEEALQKIGEQIPDLVISDIMMPKMNGLELLKRIKADAKLKNLPVIIMSNLSTPEDIEMAKSLGAADYWVKRDIQPRELERRVMEILGKGK